MRTLRPLAATTLLGALLITDSGGAADWRPTAWAEEDTVQLRTQAAAEGPHWFPVWVVVLDGDVYVRLGSRAVARIDGNTTKPILGVRIAGATFDQVEGVPAPDAAPRVADAIAAKYWSDVLIRWVPHPLTLRLVPR